MGETQTVEFRAMGKNYHLHIAPEHPYFDENRIARMIPAKVIMFNQAGVFKTSDPALIAAIRASTAFRARRVIEISDKDRALFAPKVAEQPTIRGAITAATLQKEAGVPQSPNTPPGVKLQEKTGVACDVCGKTFDDDPQGRKLRMHKINHRFKPRE